MSLWIVRRSHRAFGFRGARPSMPRPLGLCLQFLEQPMSLLSPSPAADPGNWSEPPRKGANGPANDAGEHFGEARVIRRNGLVSPFDASSVSSR